MGNRDSVKNAWRDLLEKMDLQPDFPVALRERTNTMVQDMRYLSPTNNPEALDTDRQWVEGAVEIGRMVGDYRMNAEQAEQDGTDANRATRGRCGFGHGAGSSDTVRLSPHHTPDGAFRARAGILTRDSKSRRSPFRRPSDLESSFPFPARVAGKRPRRGKTPPFPRAEAGGAWTRHGGPGPSRCPVIPWRRASGAPARARPAPRRRSRPGAARPEAHPPSRSARSAGTWRPAASGTRRGAAARACTRWS